ncbi:EI24 domain-containing protein [Poseidonocella sedimentorum]|uniref:Uncharacterized protein involved in cysteine biosynthesis n=1 Tax=Poseidonocella sedimentorum TaxID=871652 RepID=A0A1I6E855_9RHOB|nr:EI24 domain-containing protein [Poseidonocella sedimentorum]SFR13688.1 Uncharacterized protein involved in cysteine biosynthesis [Poseidonocella sedimentorum]
MISRAILLALGQLGDARFRAVLLRGLGLTAGLLLAFLLALFWGVGALVGDTLRLPLIGEVGWVDSVASWSALLLGIVLSSFMMVPVASAFTSLFLEQVAQAVEDEHYPGLPAARPVPFADALRDTLGFLGLLLVANLGAFILALIFPPFAPIIFWAVNGFLLGREYFQIAAMRRVGRVEARALRDRHRMSIWVAGVVMAIPLTVPLLNLIVPVIGAAVFTHLFHLLPGAPSGRPSRDRAR